MRFPTRLLAVLCLLPTLAWGSVTLNLKDAELSTLIATVSEVTGKNFIVDSRVKGKVTVISSRPMSAAGVYETFLGVLQVNGFAAIPDGQAIKIVPEANARQDGGVRTHDGRNLPIDDVVTYVFTLTNVSATQLVPILRPLIPQWGHLAAYSPANQLIIADRAANVQRIANLIQQMDQSSDREIQFVKLQHASASEVVRILTSIGQQDKSPDAAAKPASVIADERSNSVLLSGDKAERQKLMDVIKQLDQPLKDDGATQVVYLRYASAENLAPILEGYAQQVTRADKSAVPAAGAASASGTGESKVIADKDTNALIITAPPKAMRLVRDVIAQLDIQRAQILVEAVIAEISTNKASQLGVDWAVFNKGRIAAAGLFDPNLISAAATAVTAGSDSALLGLLGQGINIGGGAGDLQNGTSFAVLLKALQTDGDANILSTPTLVTLDNQEAKFSAGQEVPFLTGSFSNTGASGNNGSVNPFQTLERKDVGLTLGVTPQINEGDAIKLKLDLEVSAVVPGGNSLSPTTTKRKLTNTVGVENGQVLVIGGLIDDQLTTSESGVPFLSKIPLIGRLFQYSTVSKTKRNLMVFIRPSILRNQNDGNYYTRRKYDAVRQAQLLTAPAGSPLVGGKVPLLRNLDEYTADRPAPPPPAPVIPPAAAATVEQPAPIAVAPDAASTPVAP